MKKTLEKRLRNTILSVDILDFLIYSYFFREINKKYKLKNKNIHKKITIMNLHVHLIENDAYVNHRLN